MTLQGCALEKEEAVIQADLLNMTEEKPTDTGGREQPSKQPIGKES